MNTTIQRFTRLDHFIFNVRALGMTGTKEEWDEATAMIRMCLRLGIPPETERQRVLFEITEAIWGDLL
jgi:hypothetical protein